MSKHHREDIARLGREEHEMRENFRQKKMRLRLGKKGASHKPTSLRSQRIWGKRSGGESR